MSQKKYVSLSKLSTFLDKLKNTFSALGHKHPISDLTDYTVDTALSSTSTNPVQNKVLDAEFEAVSTAMNALDTEIDNKLSLSGGTLTGDLTVDGGTESKSLSVKRTVSDVIGEARVNVTNIGSKPAAALVLKHDDAEQSGLLVRKDLVTFYNYRNGNSYEMLHKGNFSNIITPSSIGAASVIIREW